MQRKNSLQSILLITLLMLFSSQPLAEERLDLKGTAIIGSNELPQVLYIVPWKKMGMSRLRVPVEMSLAKKMLEPIDRDEFHREINFYQAMRPAK